MIKSLMLLNDFFSTHPLTRDAQLKAWGRFASWQIKSCIQNEIVVPWIAGQRLAARRHMNGATGNIYAGLYEFVDMAFVLHFLRQGDFFLDVGANIGSYTVLASGVCCASTWAFEPAPKACSGLRRNISLNKLGDLVTVHETVLGDVESDVTFTIGLGCTNRVVGAGENNVRTAQQKPLDSLLGVAKPIMIKMDVEGYEENVLLGAEALLKNDCLKVIELETVTPKADEMLTRNGFELTYYEPFSRKLGPKPPNHSSHNSLYIRDRDFVKLRLKTANNIKVLNHTI